MEPPVNLKTNAPQAFHILVKPTGAICNLDCTYCFFLSKESLYPGSRFHMTDELLEIYIHQIIDSHQIPEVTIAWQGGEPTLMGVDFFQRSIALTKKYSKPGMQILNTIQTNGTLIDDEWAKFLKENNFLVGISIDGPRTMHDTFRRDKGGQSTFDKVMRGLYSLQKHAVDYNILTTLHSANSDFPGEVYHFLRDECQGKFLQFIPIIERSEANVPEIATLSNKDSTSHHSWRERPLYLQKGNQVSKHSISARQYGQFMNGVFDEWVRKDVGQVFVQMFDVALANWFGEPSGLCVHSKICGTALAMEHNGDVYSCDHFVEPNFKLGNILQAPLIELVASSQQYQFGQDKFEKLPSYCKECDVLFACYGGCPKDRFIDTPSGEPGLNYLCAGYKEFYHHIDEAMNFMVNELRYKRAPANVMRFIAQKDSVWQAKYGKIKPNDFCPCGSGKKFKKCHGSLGYTP
jgi:uncharacterized protein